MTIKLKEENPDLLVLFANTGQEREETLKFIDLIDKKYNLNVVWLESVVHHKHRQATSHVIRSYETACRNGDLFENMILKYGIPNMAYPHCTRELKLQPIKSYLKANDIRNYAMAVGIRSDESRRVSKSALRDKLIYPLVDADIDKEDIDIFFEDHDIKLNLSGYQGNCSWCWKKSFKKLYALAAETPKIFEIPDFMESKYGLCGSNKTGEKRVFFRGNTDTKALLRMAKEYSVNRHNSGIDNHTLSDDGGCSESCEAYTTN